MAKKQDPEILGCAPLKGGTHSILAYSMPVLSRKIVEVCFPCSSHHPQEFFCLEGRNPFYLGKKAELGKFRIPEVFLPLIIIIKTNRLGDFSPSNLIIPYIDSNRQSSFIVMLCPYLAPFQLSSLRALHHLGSGDWGIPNLKYDLQVWICQGKGRSPKKRIQKK